MKRIRSQCIFIRPWECTQPFWIVQGNLPACNHQGRMEVTGIYHPLLPVKKFRESFPGDRDAVRLDKAIKS